MMTTGLIATLAALGSLALPDAARCSHPGMPYQPFGRAMTEVARCAPGPQGLLSMSLVHVERRPERRGSVRVERLAFGEAEVGAEELGRLNSVMTAIEDYLVVRFNCGPSGHEVEVIGWGVETGQQLIVKIQASPDGSRLANIATPQPFQIP